MKGGVVQGEEIEQDFTELFMTDVSHGEEGTGLDTPPVGATERRCVLVLVFGLIPLDNSQKHSHVQTQLLVSNSDIQERVGPTASLARTARSKTVDDSRAFRTDLEIRGNMTSYSQSLTAQLRRPTMHTKRRWQTRDRPTHRGLFQKNRPCFLLVFSSG